MQYSTIILSSLLALASAAPHGGWDGKKGEWDGKKGGEHWKGLKSPFEFTSTYHVVATPGEVVNGTTPTGGLAGAIGYFNYGINSHLETICYNITLVGFAGNYQSPARTATHIHQAAKGQSGPPRIAFPNPVLTSEKIGGKEVRRSAGCLTAPFVTGLNVTGTTTDNGSASGFKLSQIEANPAGFFTDVHSSLAVPGAVRGQLG